MPQPSHSTSCYHSTHAWPRVVISLRRYKTRGDKKPHVYLCICTGIPADLNSRPADLNSIPYPLSAERTGGDLSLHNNRSQVSHCSLDTPTYNVAKHKHPPRKLCIHSDRQAGVPHSLGQQKNDLLVLSSGADGTCLRSIDVHTGCTTSNSNSNGISIRDDNLPSTTASTSSMKPLDLTTPRKLSRTGAVSHCRFSSEFSRSATASVMVTQICG